MIVNLIYFLTKHYHSNFIIQIFFLVNKSCYNSTTTESIFRNLAPFEKVLQSTIFSNGFLLIFLRNMRKNKNEKQISIDSSSITLIYTSLGSWIFADLKNMKVYRKNIFIFCVIIPNMRLNDIRFS